jgi:hypothetical protein
MSLFKFLTRKPPIRLFGGITQNGHFRRFIYTLSIFLQYLLCLQNVREFLAMLKAHYTRKKLPGTRHHRGIRVLEELVRPGAN